MLHFLSRVGAVVVLFGAAASITGQSSSNKASQDSMIPVWTISISRQGINELKNGGIDSAAIAAIEQGYDKLKDSYGTDYRIGFYWINVAANICALRPVTPDGRLLFDGIGAAGYAQLTDCPESATKIRAAIEPSEQPGPSLEWGREVPRTQDIEPDDVDWEELEFAEASASRAGPNTIYVHGIKYRQFTYGAVLRYVGDGVMTVDAVYWIKESSIPMPVGNQVTVPADGTLRIRYTQGGHYVDMQYKGGRVFRVSAPQRQ